LSLRKDEALKVQVLNSAGTVLSTLATCSSLNHNTGYAQHSFNLGSYAGAGVQLLVSRAGEWYLLVGAGDGWDLVAGPRSGSRQARRCVGGSARNVDALTLQEAGAASFS
jgi:hypothetical protein